MTSGPEVPSVPAPPAIRLLTRQEGRREQPVMVWAPGPGWRAISSALLGGGLGPRAWWLDAQVDKEYFHPDPVEHAREIARGLGLLPDAGVAMLTAADVRRWTGASDSGVRVAATVGLGLPVRAAVAEEVAAAEASTRVGTINLLVVVPAPLSDAALVNAGGDGHRGQGPGAGGGRRARYRHRLGRRLHRVPRYRCGRRRAGALRRSPVDLGSPGGPCGARRGRGRYRGLARRRGRPGLSPLRRRGHRRE